MKRTCKVCGKINVKPRSSFCSKKCQAYLDSRKDVIFNKTREYKIPSLIEILPDAIGRFFVRYTFESNSLSKISFTIQPADLIKTDPRKKRIK